MRRSPRRTLVGFAAAMAAVFLTGSSCDFGGSSSTSKTFDSIKTNPTLLRSFLQDFPKGADLHNHLSGAIYAEDFISWAAQSRQCFDSRTSAIVAPPCSGTAKRPVRQALTDRVFNDQIIDALSMRHFVPEQSPAVDSGYGQFFGTLGRFSAASIGRTAEALTSARSLAAANNLGYVEYMVTPAGSAASALGTKVGLNKNLAVGHQLLQRRGLTKVVRSALRTVGAVEAQFDKMNSCNSWGSGNTSTQGACSVETRYLYQVNRELPPAQVFSQFATGFQLARSDQRFAGINLAAPENGPVALRDYDLHMSMISYLQSIGPPINIALHAGELKLGLVPPKYLGTHIAKAIRAGATRIGTGTDIAYAANPAQLMAQMRDQNITVEIEFTSSKQILGVSGADHPFQTYRSAGVPLTLGTDDQGVSRIDMTHEYQTAVSEYGLSYGDLVALSRQSLESAFLSGVSLWEDGVGSAAVDQCANDVRNGNVSEKCGEFLDDNAKAAAEFALELRINSFEDERAKSPPTATPTGAPPTTSSPSVSPVQ